MFFIMKTTVAKIYINNFKHNINQIKSLLKPNVKICVAVKADAYGHGAIRCAKEAVALGVDFLAVARVSEGIELREAGINVPILLLSLCNPNEYSDLIKYKITPFVFDEQYILGISEAVKNAKQSSFNVHLAIDTGMGRIGCNPSDAAKLAKFIISTGNLKLEGVASHCSVADSDTEDDKAYTKKQFDLFNSAVESIKNAGIDPGIRHISNSAVAINNPEMQLDMIRPGIIVYGYYPGDFNKDYFIKRNVNIELLPVMALCTKLCSIRKCEKGKAISYGRTFVTQSETNIGVLPIGYADGMLRSFLKANIFVSINKNAYPLCGRICMDQCMIDLGPNVDVNRWDEVIIFGPKNKGAKQTAQEIADATGTISYEITCGISKRVERIYIED